MSVTALLQNNYFDDNHRREFLDRHGWEITAAVGQDSSIRRYFRVHKNGHSAILMETLPDDSPYVTLGHFLGDFVRVGQWLAGIGLKTPTIFEQDLERGYLLLEDLGDVCFRDAQDDAGQRELYTLAADVLKHIADAECPLVLPDYYQSHVHKRHRRVVDWFVPLARGVRNEDGLVEAYKGVWAEIEASLPAPDLGFMYVDFHAQNLMWLPQEKGLKRCGLLDFQGAMIGPQIYDLTNLLEDARRDVDASVKAEIINGLSDESRAWFRVMGTQFHCRVIGQFIKMAVMDDNPQYMPHIPRLQRYIATALSDELLAPLAGFFKELGVDFSASHDINIETLRALVREDAY